MSQQSPSPPLIPTSNNYDITEFNGFSRNDDDYDLANTYPTAHLPNMGLDYDPSNLVHIDDVEQFINFNTNTLVNLKGKPIHHDYYHNNSSNVSTICDTFIDQETQQIIIKTIPGFGLCDEFYHKLHLPEGFEPGPKYDTTYKKPFKGGGKKDFNKKKNWKPRKK